MEKLAFFEKDYFQELRNEKRRKRRLKLKFLLMSLLQAGDLEEFNRLLSQITDEEEIIEITKDDRLLIICICNGYLNEFQRMVEFLPKSMKIEKIQKEKFADFLIYDNNESFNHEIFVKFMCYFMDLDMNHCLEVFQQKKFISPEAKECFEQMQEERLKKKIKKI